jgi:hypothetical protein
MRLSWDVGKLQQVLTVSAVIARSVNEPVVGFGGVCGMESCGSFCVGASGKFESP